MTNSPPQSSSPSWSRLVFESGRIDSTACDSKELVGRQVDRHARRAFEVVDECRTANDRHVERPRARRQ